MRHFLSRTFCPVCTIEFGQSDSPFTMSDCSLGQSGIWTIRHFVGKKPWVLSESLLWIRLADNLRTSLSIQHVHYKHDKPQYYEIRIFTPAMQRWPSSGVGVTPKPVSSIQLFFLIFFHHFQNTGYLLNITLIFDWCHTSWAVVTFVRKPNSYFCKIKNQLKLIDRLISL